MKTAKQIFEELGYIFKIDEDGDLSYTKLRKSWNKSWYVSIYFFASEKCFIVEEANEPMEIDMPTFKAIHKQLEELGWLE